MNNLIPRERSYVLNRKLVSICSEDRDINIWPNANHFEITLPEIITNVQSIFLSYCNMPIPFYTFSNSNKNTKFSFNYKAINYLITIDEGFYDGFQLALEVQNKMNIAINKSKESKDIEVKFNIINNKLYFISQSPTLQLLFNQEITYDITCSDNINIWNKTSHWGLPYYLGFQKKIYTTTYDPSFSFTYTDEVDVSTNKIIGETSINMFKETNIFLEIEKFNSIDELSNLNYNSNNLYNNHNYGKVNSFFAKIPINNVPFNLTVNNKNTDLDTLTTYNPPIEKVSKLKFKFRYHDGRLVDFGNHPFSFMIGFNSLLNEIAPSFNIRQPATLNY